MDRLQRRHTLGDLDEAIKLLSCPAKFGAYSGYILLMSLRQCADAVFYLYCVETIRSGEQVDVLLHREMEEEDVIRDRSFDTNLESGRTRTLSRLRGSRGFKPCSTWRHGIRKKKKAEISRRGIQKHKNVPTGTGKTPMNPLLPSDELQAHRSNPECKTNKLRISHHSFFELLSGLPITGLDVNFPVAQEMGQERNGFHLGELAPWAHTWPSGKHGEVMLGYAVPARGAPHLRVKKRLGIVIYTCHFRWTNFPE